MSLLTDRASILREFFRLVNADSTDDDMIEHDSSTLEGAYEALDVGQKRAQLFLIAIGQGDAWRKTSSALTISGSDPDVYASLPADFLRLDSDPDQRRSGLRYANGEQWGSEIDPDDRNRVKGRYYWVTWDAVNAEARVRFARGASAPATLLADYYYKLGTLADSTDVEMRGDDRNLIPAFAADYAKNQTWFAGDMEDAGRIDANLRNARNEARMRGRLTRRSRRVQTTPTSGRWII